MRLTVLCAVCLALCKGQETADWECDDGYDTGAIPKPWADFESCEVEADGCHNNAKIRLGCKKTCKECETHASSPVDVEKDNAEKSIESMEGELKQADDLSRESRCCVGYRIHL
jgi:hypothetical protein